MSLPSAASPPPPVPHPTTRRVGSIGKYDGSNLNATTSSPPASHASPSTARDSFSFSSGFRPALRRRRHPFPRHIRHRQRRRRLRPQLQIGLHDKARHHQRQHPQHLPNLPADAQRSPPRSALSPGSGPCLFPVPKVSRQQVPLKPTRWLLKRHTQSGTSKLPRIIVLKVDGLCWLQEPFSTPARKSPSARHLSRIYRSFISQFPIKKPPEPVAGCISRTIYSPR